MKYNKVGIFYQPYYSFFVLIFLYIKKYYIKWSILSRFPKRPLIHSLNYITILREIIDNTKTIYPQL